MLLYHSQAASSVLSDTIDSHPFGTISQINCFHYELLLPPRFITVKKKRYQDRDGYRIMREDRSKKSYTDCGI